MRIMIFAAGGDIGGGKTHILALAKQLSEKNDLRLVSFRREVLSSEARALGIDVADIDAGEGFFATAKFAMEQVRLFDPDIIHCHGAKANMLGIMAKKKFRIPVMTTVHSDPRLDYLGSPFKQYSFGVVNEIALKNMDYYVAVAGRMRELLIRRGADPQRIFTIYNGLDFSGASDEPRKSVQDRKTILVGIAARLNPVKDIPTVIKAFARAYEQDDRLRLSIAGVGEDEKALKKLVSDLGLSSVTSFEGWIDDVNSYFKKVDINVLSSLSETFPYSLLEGAYEHCPAIATDVGGIPTLIKHGETGYLFKPGDVETFASYILKLADDPELRSRLAENLYKKARSEFSLERMKNDQQSFYETAIRRSKTQPMGAVLCGAYGKGNAGDEAILRAIISQLKSIDEDMPFWVMSRSPMQTKLSAGVNSFYIFDLFKFFKALKKSRLFVNGGGSLIQDVTSSRSLYFYLFTLKAAKTAGCRIIMYGCGVGPLIKENHKKIAGRVLDSTADIITLRDSVSLELLKEIGVSKPEIVIAADPTFSLPKLQNAEIDRAFEKEGIPCDVPMIGFCLREWKSFTAYDAIADAAEYAYEKYGLCPVFIPIEHPSDLRIGDIVSSRLKIPFYVCRESHDASCTIGMLSRMRLVCGMRLHSLIFATSGNTPVIGLSYDVKVDSFIKDIGSNACVPVSCITDKWLRSEIDKAMSGDGADAEMIGNKLRRLEKKNREAAAWLLNR